jgi:uncharacterized repeat protein (TIGR01451 family)
MKSWLSVGVSAVVALVVVLLAMAGPAEAAFPGSNGRIVFDQFDGDDAEIYTANPDGSGVIQVTDNSVDDYDPAWSADGKKLAFEGDMSTALDPDNFEIFTIDIDAAGGPAGSPFRVTNNSDNDAQPAFSPDGRQISYTKLSCSADIYRTPAGGGTETRIPTPQDSWAFQPAWSPDGSRIAYAGVDLSSGAGCPEGDDPKEISEVAAGFFEFDIYSINLQTDAIRQVTTNGALDQNPNWSPDGTRIAYESVPDSSDNAEVFTVPSAGGTPTQVTDSAGNVDNGNPAYSPDGAQIVYESCACDGAGALFRINSRAVKGVGTRIPNTAEALAPDWQPLNANLVLTKTGSPNPVTVGRNLTYTLSVTNNGPNPATNVIIRDTLSFGVTFVTAQSGCTSSGRVVTCNVGTLASEGTASKYITVRANQAGTLTNTATATSAVRDPSPATTTATTRAIPPNKPPMAVNDFHVINGSPRSPYFVRAPGILINDIDPEDGRITASLFRGPSHGRLTLNADGSFSYTPSPTFHGTDFFTYRASDGGALSNVATVRIIARSE